MTAFPFGLLIVLAAMQVSTSPRGTLDPARPAAATLSGSDQAETGVGSQSFSRLFTVSEDDIRQARLRAQLESQRQAVKPPPRIVCGMVVIQADPGIDPKMIQRPLATRPTDEPASTFHIKRISPTSCAE
jgi:hypothetical protein